MPAETEEALAPPEKPRQHLDWQLPAKYVHQETNHVVGRKGHTVTKSESPDEIMQRLREKREQEEEEEAPKVRQPRPKRRKFHAEPREEEAKEESDPRLSYRSSLEALLKDSDEEEEEETEEVDVVEKALQDSPDEIVIPNDTSKQTKIIEDKSATETHSKKGKGKKSKKVKKIQRKPVVEEEKIDRKREVIPLVIIIVFLCIFLFLRIFYGDALNPRN